MAQKGISPRNSSLFLAASITIFFFAEVIAEVADIWLTSNPSVNNLLTFNRWYSTIPPALTTGAIVFMLFGLIYYSGRTIILVIVSGIILAVVPFVLEPYSFFSFQLQYYPGHYMPMVWEPLSNLFNIGLGVAIAAIVSIFFRGSLVQKTVTVE